jgi:hypothetical protein
VNCGWFLSCQYSFFHTYTSNHVTKSEVRAEAVTVLQDVKILIDSFGCKSFKSNLFLDFNDLFFQFWILVDEFIHPSHSQWRIIAALLE